MPAPPLRKATGAKASVDLTAETSQCPVRPAGSATHTVTIKNGRPNLIDNVVVTSRSTHGLFAFSGANNWSHNFGLIPDQQGLFNRNHVRKSTTNITAIGPEGNDDVIETDAVFIYQAQTTQETIPGLSYLIQIRK
jgi:hypothetical protein